MRRRTKIDAKAAVKAEKGAIERGATTATEIATEIEETGVTATAKNTETAKREKVARAMKAERDAKDVRIAAKDAMRTAVRIAKIVAKDVKIATAETGTVETIATIEIGTATTAREKRIKNAKKTRITVRKNSIFIVLAVMALAFAGCDRSVFYTQSQRVDERGWNMDDHLKFDVDVSDTMRIYNFFVDVRNSVEYPYAQTYFFIRTTFPDGSIAVDTLGCPLADVDGRWYGKRTGKYIDNRYYFRKNVIFPMSGTYHFDVAHAMRDTNIVGLKNVGMRIEYATKTKH